MRIHSGKALGQPVEPHAGKGRPVDERMNAFIDQSTVFMLVKGTPMMPQCGFSATVIEIMNRLGVPYATFNVLADPEIRAGAKQFSNWPTFPQVFVGGEFVGGCDIAVEMYESGDLEKTVKEALEAKGPGDMHAGNAAGSPGTPTDARDTFNVPESARAKGEGLAEVQELTPKKVNLLGKENFVLVDVREPEEFEHTQIEGSQLFPMADFGSRYEELPKDAKLLLICRTGNRSQRAGEFLVAKGFRHIYNLTGGTNAWSREVDNSVTEY